MSFRGELYKRKVALAKDFEEFQKANDLNYDIKFNIRGGGINKDTTTFGVTFSIDYDFGDRYSGLVYQNETPDANVILQDLDSIIFYCKDQIFKGEYDMQWGFGMEYQSLKSKLKKDVKNIQNKLELLP